MTELVLALLDYDDDFSDWIMFLQVVWLKDNWKFESSYIIHMQIF